MESFNLATKVGFKRDKTFRRVLLSKGDCLVFSPNTPFLYERARLAPYELIHITMEVIASVEKYENARLKFGTGFS